MDIDGALGYMEVRGDEAEVFHIRGTSSTLDIKKDSPDLFKESVHSGYGIRIIKDGREGFAYSNNLSKDVLERALKGARAASRDPYTGFPDRGDYRAVKGCFDKGITALEPTEVMDLARQMVGPCSEVGAQPTTGGITWSHSQVTITNSHGVRGSEEETSISAHLATVARDADTHTGFHYGASRMMDLDFEDIGRESARLAVDSLGASRIGTQTLDVTLRPFAVAELLEGTLVPSFIADNVQRGRSLLAGRVGEKVLAESMDIRDTGNLPSGIMSAAFDGEGVPTGDTHLVDKGVLKGFLYDCYTGRKDARESTGNADRPTYSTPPRSQASNFVVNGPRGMEEGGLLVHGLIGAHTSNPVTGDFSLETRNAFLDGKPVKKAIITGNVYDLLNKIKGYGGDTLQVSSVRAPSIQFEDVRVVG